VPGQQQLHTKVLHGCLHSVEIGLSGRDINPSAVFALLTTCCCCCCRLQVNAWHQAQPPQGFNGISDHALVSNRQEGLLLAVGGYYSDRGGMYRAARPHVLMYDVVGGSWLVDPSGCTYPGAGGSTCAAVAVDDYTIMVLGSSRDGKSARNDLLDLRTWRWRSGSGLTNDMTRNIGLVMYEGQVLAVGGRQEYVSLHMGVQTATHKVRAYDAQRDAWSELAPLPFTGPLPVGVFDACHVTMRLANALA
jgi:hypothetical protein